MKRIKYGRLYWLQIQADDIDKFLLVRIFRKLGIFYIPFTLRRYDELYLREDRSKYSRRLINRCRQLGIVTYVVQEGPIYHLHQAKWSHLPLYADIFLCPPGDCEMWVKEGMPKDRIKTYDPQKKKEDYRGVFFLDPLTTWDDAKDLSVNRRNAQILKAVYDRFDGDVLFAPDPRNAAMIRPFLPPHRIAEEGMDEIIRRYDRFECLAGSVAIEKCRAADKPCRVLNVSELPAAGEKKEGRGVALLGAFVAWKDLGFTWRKDFYNVRVFNSLAELAGKDVLFKPHFCHWDLLEPFLPPDKVVWTPVEELIKSHDEIYCFWDSSVRKDCEMLGKPCKLIGAGEIVPE